ncbi:MAG: hypothetical protein ACE5KM_19275 [Planctomycetaceae bacterium]
MESDQARLALVGRDDRFVIGAGFWDDVVSWAIAHGWICRSLKDLRQWDDRCEFSAEEASRLAEALDVIGGNLVLQSHENVSEAFLAQLADALLTLQRFAESGGFHVIPLK